MAHTTKENRDIYYRKAKEEGFRARSAYKLLQIFESFHILYPKLDEESALSILLNSSCSYCEHNINKNDFIAKIFSSDHTKQNCCFTGADSDSELDDYSELGLVDYVKIKRNCLELGRIKNVVDLCSAPGSWSQLLSKMVHEDYETLKNACKKLQTQQEVCKNLVEYVNIKPVIVAIDIQQMAPIEGVRFLKGDITDPEILKEVLQLFIENVSRNINQAYGGEYDEKLRRNAQLITCDGAPDISGLHETDSFLQSYLIKSALSVCFSLLDPDGCFICKTFFSSENTPIFTQVSSFFDYCTIFKPSASRSSSFEHFIVAVGYKPFGHILNTPKSQEIDDEREIDSELKEIIKAAGKVISWD
uniref:Ribosomal RNA methyltransferase (FtsJ homologue), putative n=1 Tax=Theileria annulata TaxID=5874 RepID=A0A3B0MV56_THEAN